MAKILKVCKYCGQIHPIGYECTKKPKKKKFIKEPKLYQFRNSSEWKAKRKEIKDRDYYLCQACLHFLPGTIKRINSERLSVHHIIPLVKDWDRRLDDDNLITLCDKHHEMAEVGEITVDKLQSIANGKNISPPVFDQAFF